MTRMPVQSQSLIDKGQNVPQTSLSQLHTKHVSFLDVSWPSSIMHSIRHTSQWDLLHLLSWNEPYSSCSHIVRMLATEHLNVCNMWQTSAVCCHCTWLTQQSEPTQPSKINPAPLQNTSYFRNAGTKQHTSANTEHIKSFKGVMFHCTFLRHVMEQHMCRNPFSLGLFQQFSVSWPLFFLLVFFSLILFHQNLKLFLRIQVTVSGRLFHGSNIQYTTPRHSLPISRNVVMTGFFELLGEHDIKHISFIHSNSDLNQYVLVHICNVIGSCTNETLVACVLLGSKIK